jgi:hypothetical protein
VVKELSFLSLPVSGKGSINSTALSLLQMKGTASVSTKGNDETVFDAEISILKELKEVKWVEFGCNDHPYGAPFVAKLNLNGLYDINGGGELKLTIEFPESYHLKDEKGEYMQTHHIFDKSYTIKADQKEIEIRFYLSKIGYQDNTLTEGKLKIDDPIKYSYELKMDLGTGNYDLNSLPTFTLGLEEVNYKDIEVKINHIEIPEVSLDVNYTFDGLPSAIKVAKVAFEEAPLKLSLRGLEWLEVKCYDTGDIFHPTIEITLPECMHFKSHSLLSSGHTIYATTAQFASGITLNIDYIDCNANGVK